MPFFSFPDTEVLERAVAETPEFMFPSSAPYAAGFGGYLSADECEAIQESLGRLTPYVVDGCRAATRECVDDPSLEPVKSFATMLNETFWRYSLGQEQRTWLQTYGVRGKYQRHADASPGQTRKLTAVALLSDPDLYEGGDLEMFVIPKAFKVPREQGTVVVFQSWVEHEVSPITRGERQTINMGFWGPHFR